MKVRRRRLVDVGLGDVERIWRGFGRDLRGQWWRLAAALLFALMVAALELARPWPVQIVVDDILVTEEPIDLADRRLHLAVGLTFLVPLLLGWASTRLQVTIAQVSRAATVRIRQRLFVHLQRLELAAHHRAYSGDLLVRLLGDVNMVRDVLFASWVNVLSRSVLFAGTAVILLVIDPLVAAAALAPVPLLWVGTTRTSRKVKQVSGKQRRKEGRLAARAAESLRQIPLTKAFAAEDVTAETFVAETRSAERASLKATRLSARLGATTEMLTGLGTAMVLLAGVHGASTGRLSPGQVVVAVSYARMLYKPLRKLTGEGARMAKAVACADRILDLLDEPVETTEGRPAPDFDGAVSFVRVGHVYGDGRRALDDVSLHITPGELVVVAGDNGSGKSTLLQLLLRLHTPTEGRVLVDGRRIDRFALDSYRRRIAYVPQDLLLWSGTIRENLRFGTPDATDDELLAAADVALLTPVLERLPDGLDTVLGEHGSSLSGGEARRVMLARAALRDASILLLDEPLAALDPESREHVALAIRRIAAGRTTIVVNHGPGDELLPDRVVRIHHGRRIDDLDVVAAAPVDDTDTAPVAAAASTVVAFPAVPVADDGRDALWLPPDRQVAEVRP